MEVWMKMTWTRFTSHCHILACFGDNNDAHDLKHFIEFHSQIQMLHEIME